MAEPAIASSIATRAIVFPGVNQIEIRDVTVPPPGETEILVQTLYSMVSTGTELRVLAGEYGAKDAFPLFPGFSSIGRVMQANYLAEVSINPFNFFAGEGVTILTPADRTVDDRNAVVEHIRRGNIKSSDFVDEVRRVEDAPKAYRDLQRDPGKHFSLAFAWSRD